MELPVTRSTRALFLVALYVLVAPTAQSGIGRTPGRASVSPDGEARYSIAIDLPPGTNGMTPSVSLEYGHRTRGGLLGVGWSVGGLSQITRCARTIAQDGITSPPLRTVADRFCLDGQRLVVVNQGTYEAPGAEYRTEIESYSRIRAVPGASTNGPAYFTVETADGLIREYGATNDSRIDGALGASIYGARAWALNRMRDRTGNVIDYKYTEETGGAFRIASIEYNSNPSLGLAATHQVAFTYEVRPNQEVDSGFVAGMPVRQVMQLTRIGVMYADALRRSYLLGYEPALSSGGRSRLSSVTECGAGGTDCLAPTTFKWQNGSEGASSVIAFAAQVPATAAIVPERGWNFLDINGDGRNDAVWAGGTDAASATIRYRLSLSDSTFGPSVNSGVPCPRGIGVPFDVNGDGRTDLLMMTANAQWAIARGTATGIGPATNTGIAMPAGTRDFRGADLNGDGLGDIAWSEAPDPYGNSLTVRARLATSTGGFGPPVTLYTQREASGYLEAEGGEFIGPPGQRIDLDGDGAEELLMNENFSMARVFLSGYGTDHFDRPVGGAAALDFNDDGCSDLAYARPSGNLRVRIATCTKGGATAEIDGPAWGGPGQVFAQDWNGDGRDDILVRGSVNWMVALSRGDSIAPITDTGVPHDDAAAISGRDLDGDGMEDLALRTPSQIRLRLRNGPVPDLLASISDGFGSVAEFAYRPLTDAAVHTPGTGASWPEQDLQTNDSVVSKFTTTDGSGTGGKASELIRYEGLRRNAQGRGLLGFRKVIRTEASVNRPLVTELTRRQDFPFAGLPETVVTQQPSGKAISATAYRWSMLGLGTSLGLRHFPYAQTTTTSRFEVGGLLDGSEIARTVKSVSAIDSSSGIVTDETTTTSEVGGGANAGSSASIRILLSSFLNDSTNWCLGRTQSVEITASHTLPGGVPVTRIADQTWDAAKCRPTRIRLFPGDSQQQVTYNLAYDATGNIASEKVTGAGMASRTLAVHWGTRGQLPVRITDPLGQVSRIDWDDGVGLPLSFTDPNGAVSRWTYDPFGRSSSEKQPDLTATSWTRENCSATCDARAKYRLRQDDLDSAGNVRASSWLEMDMLDHGFRLESEEPGGGRSVSSLDTDERGRVSRIELPHWDGDSAPGYLQWSYDAIGRVTAEGLFDAGGVSVRTSTMRFEGLAATQRDPLGNQTTLTRLAWGSPTELRDAAGRRNHYEYDAVGNLLQMRDALDTTVAKIEYSPGGRRLAAEDMDLGRWTFTRNALGETTAVRDAKSQTFRYEYDVLGRITKRIAPDGTSSWTWGSLAAKHEIGRLASIAGPEYSETFAYDAAGRPASQTIVADSNYRFDFTYNTLGLLDTLTYPVAGSGVPLKLRHDYSAGQLTRIRNANALNEPFWALNAQDAAGRPLDETLVGSIRIVTGFSPVTGNQEYRQTTAGVATPIQDLSYDWDANGNLERRRDASQGLVEEFDYDERGRLRESRLNGIANLTVSYDATGNLIGKSDVCPGTASCFTYDATRRHAVASAGGQTYAYDSNGNMTRRAGAVITWSSDNLPLSIAGPNGNTSQFSYGPAGNRWRQVASYGSTNESTVYAGGLFEKVTRGALTTWRHYLPMPGGVALQLRYSDGSPSAMRVLTLDHLGSTDRIVDSAGNILTAESFGAFGSRRKLSWAGIPTASDLAKIAAVTRVGFTGHEQLDNVDLIHMNGRVYDPRIGRFISADPYLTQPFHSQGLNRYSYVLNNPLSFIDPSGFDAVPCLANEAGNCVQITVIGLTWADYMRAFGGAHSAEIASALERDPCGQNGSALACSMASGALVSPSSIVLTVGRQPNATLSTGGRFDAFQGFAARAGNLAIGSSPIAMLFGADPDFQYFREPDSASGRAGSLAGNVGYLLGGAVGMVRKAGSNLISRGPSAFARSLQGTAKYPGIDRFRDITLKKGTLLYGGFPGQTAFYTTSSALRRAGESADRLFGGLQVRKHAIFGYRTRVAAYEVTEDTQAAMGLAIANVDYGTGWLPQVVVPSYEASLRFLREIALVP
jgi:RHS repeat-associated protein